MPWIKVIQEWESEGELKEAYERMRQVNIDYNDEMLAGMPPNPGPHPATPPELASLNPPLHALRPPLHDARHARALRRHVGGAGDDRHRHLAGLQLSLLNRRSRRGPA